MSTLAHVPDDHGKLSQRREVHETKQLLAKPVSATLSILLGDCTVLRLGLGNLRLGRVLSGKTFP